ncbi:MAG: hypothetical protein ACKV2T_15920 [Kofleriaceae bacterium]
MQETKTTKSATERRATVRIDATAAGGKEFQGVWLEFPGGKRWVVDYRPREFWTGFADQEVIVTGQCYEHDPRVQAIGSQHFRVDSMKMATPRRGLGPILELGPEQALRGTFVSIGAPPGSKAEGSSQTRFVDERGGSHMVQGASIDLPAMNKPVWINARAVTPDYSYVATTTSDRPKLWILEVAAHDHVEDKTMAPTPVDCPD